MTKNRRQRSVPITIEHDDQWVVVRVIETAIEVGLLAAASMVFFCAFLALA